MSVIAMDYMLFKGKKLILQDVSEWEIIKYIRQKHGYSLAEGIRYDGYAVYRAWVDMSQNYK